MSDAFPSSQRRGGCAERSEGADGVVSSAKRFAELLLRLRPIGLALRATQALSRLPSSARRGMLLYLQRIILSILE